MSTREGAWQSKNDHSFILRALRSGRRIDGRKLGDMRLLRMVFARAEGQASCEVQLGRTRVLAVVKGEVSGCRDRDNTTRMARSYAWCVACCYRAVVGREGVCRVLFVILCCATSLCVCVAGYC